MMIVSQATLLLAKEAVQNGQPEFITHEVEVPIPYGLILKYWRKVIYGKVKQDVREIIKTLCEYKKVKITAGAVCLDHVHLCLELPPKYSISSFMGTLKGKRIDGV